MSTKMNKDSAAWYKFFKAAGIPNEFTTKYALIFDENRIKMDMLVDLNKELLKDVGINAMGDIIAILKYAKKVHEESKEEAFEANKPTIPQATVSPINERKVQPASVVKKVVSSTVAAMPSASSNKVTRKTEPSSVKIAPILSNKNTIKSAASSSAAPSSNERQVQQHHVVSIIRPSLSSFSKPAPSKQDLIREKYKNMTSTSSTRTESSSNTVAFNTKRGTTITLNSSMGSSSASKPVSTPTPTSILNNSKRKISYIDDSSSSNSPKLREEVPVQKKIRVLPEHEGKYQIKMPQGTTPRTEKLFGNNGNRTLESDRRSSSQSSAASSSSKKTIFDRLGGSPSEVKVRVDMGSFSRSFSNTTNNNDGDRKNEINARFSSTTSSNRPIGIGVTRSIPNDMPKRNSFPERSAPSISSSKSASSVFSRLGGKTSEERESRNIRKPIVYDDKSSSDSVKSLVSVVGRHSHSHSSPISIISRRPREELIRDSRSNRTYDSRSNRGSHSHFGERERDRERSRSPAKRTSSNPHYSRQEEEEKRKREIEMKERKYYEDRERERRQTTTEPTVLSKIVKTVKRSRDEYFDQASEEGTVIKTERFPSSTKGKTIIKRTIVKLKKKAPPVKTIPSHSEMELLSDYEDPLDYE